MRDDAKVYDVEAEVVKVKVGSLTIEHKARGGPMTGMGAVILFDGKPPPFLVKRLVLTIDAEEVVRVAIEGYPVD